MDFRRIGGGRPVLEEENNELIRTANGKKNRLIDAANGAKGSPDYVAKFRRHRRRSLSWSSWWREIRLRRSSSSPRRIMLWLDLLTIRIFNWALL